MSVTKIIMLFIAIILDISGFFVFLLDFIGVGNFVSLLLDIVGFVTIGLWSFFKGGSILRKGLKTFGSYLVESIPFLGDVSPTWTIVVLTTKD